MSVLHAMDCSGEHYQPDERRVCFFCPGCECGHWVRIAGTAGVWTFNGDMERPTFTPSILVRGGTVCHCYVTDGQIRFLDDCTHALAGKTVPLEPF